MGAIHGEDWVLRPSLSHRCRPPRCGKFGSKPFKENEMESRRGPRITLCMCIPNDTIRGNAKDPMKQMVVYILRFTIPLVLAFDSSVITFPFFISIVACVVPDVGAIVQRNRTPSVWTKSRVRLTPFSTSPYSLPLRSPLLFFLLSILRDFWGRNLLGGTRSTPPPSTSQTLPPSLIPYASGWLDGVWGHAQPFEADVSSRLDLLFSKATRGFRVNTFK